MILCCVENDRNLNSKSTSGTSRFQDRCLCVEMRPRSCCSVSAVALQPSGWRPRSSTDCIDWMRPAARRPDVNRTAEFCFPWALMEKFTTRLPARLLSVTDEHFQTGTENASLHTTTSVIRRGCSVSVILASTYKCQDLYICLTRTN